MEQKNILIQVLKIIACIGVFNGHFLGLTLDSQMAMDFLGTLRNSWLSRTVLCLLFQGDTNVRLFFVVSGYLSLLSFKKAETNIARKVVNRYIYLIIPSIIVTLMCGVSWKIQELFAVPNIVFSITELVNDLVKIVITGGIPYYSYQLWFINDMCICIVLSLTMCLLHRNNERKVIKILYVTICAIFSLRSMSCFSFFCGIIAAELTGKVIISRKYRSIICIICVFIFPFLFNEQHLNYYNIMALSICFAIILMEIQNFRITSVIDIQIMERRKNIISFFEKNSYSFYLIHVFNLKTLISNIYPILRNLIQNEIMLIGLLYVIAIFSTWILADIFTKVIIVRIKNIFPMKVR